MCATRTETTTTPAIKDGIPRIPSGLNSANAASTQRSTARSNQSISEEAPMWRCVGFWLCAVACVACCCSGCSPITMAKKDILAAYSENATADWRLERSRGEDGQGYYSIPLLERALIAQGAAAEPIAEEFLESFDHRLRCTGLTVLIAVRGSKGVTSVLIDHLDDPYGPIRWHCWHALYDMGIIALETMPPKRDCLRPWRTIKEQCIKQRPDG